MILVFGSNGLLGSTLCSLYPKDVIGVSRQECDISQPKEIYKLIENKRPDVVINCAGIVRGRSVSDEYYYKVNTAAPILMADACDQFRTRFIQVSTDCVFDGKRGSYVEIDTPNPTDLYGITKLRGEITRGSHLTIRSSFIGWPDPNSRGLIAWLMTKQGEEITGYRHVMWNGLTTVGLATYLIELACNYQLTGLRHIYGETVSKYDILSMVNSIFKLGCTIIPAIEPVKFMTLQTIYSDLPQLPDTFNLYKQIIEMKELYNELTN